MRRSTRCSAATPEPRAATPATGGETPDGTPRRRRSRARRPSPARAGHRHDRRGRAASRRSQDYQSALDDRIAAYAAGDLVAAAEADERMQQAIERAIAAIGE